MAPLETIAPRAATAPRPAIAPRATGGMAPRPLTTVPRPRAAIAGTPPLLVGAPRITGDPRVMGIPRAPRTAEVATRPLEAGIAPLMGEPRVFTGEGLGTVLVGVDIGDLLATGVILSWLGCGCGEGIRACRFCCII